MVTVAPYGSWRSPITANLLVSDAVRLSSVQVDGEDVYWNERRPAEGGRQVVVRHGHGDALPANANARTLAHEYGGRSYTVRDGVLLWSEFEDQRLYRTGPAAPGGSGDSGGAVPLTGPPAAPRGVRFADMHIEGSGQWVACVRETHGESPEPRNEVVAVATDGSGAVVLAAGHDFYAYPRFSPDGSRLCWISWDHPNMPWDGTELWVASWTGDGVADARLVAGGPEESVLEPRWAPDGDLYWVSDRTGWWNLHSERRGHVAAADAEFGGPLWVFGQSHYALLADGTLVAAWTSGGTDRLGVVTAGGDVEPLDLPFTVIGSIEAVDGGVVGLFGSPSQAVSVARVAIPSGRFEVLRTSHDPGVDQRYFSAPRAIRFPTTGDRDAHALFYAPANPDFTGPEAERPPLIVLSHGGPTSQALTDLDLDIQFWTSRGIAVVDVNYGGSSGYGRAYRDRLQGTWGVTDVDDCVAAARWLAAEDLVDGERVVIRGGSAGGYTTLAALTFRPGVFACGSSHYGVADAEALARDTHKFESRYLDGLIGAYPAERETYRARSPIHHTDRLSCPLILFQGLEDKVVPPEQSQMMAEALAVKGIPHAHLTFEGEQHGFRRSETIVRVAEAELSFFAKVLGFTPADEVAPVRIEHEAALAR